MNTAIAEMARNFARLAGGFRASRVILTANNLGLFERIGAGKNAAHLAKALRTDARATEILLDAVTALGLLAKRGGVYRLTPPAKQLLLPSSPWYQGDMLRHADRLWQNWSGLDDVVKTGMPNRAGRRDHNVFIRAMHNIAVFRVDAVVKALNLGGVRTAIDLGGGPGTYSIALAKKGVAVTLFDHPETLEVAKEMITRGRTPRVTFRGGDFHFDDIGGPYDLAFLSQVLHSLSETEIAALLGKVYDALAPKGQVAVHEFSLNDDHASPVPGALFSINMLVNTAAGRSYTPKEVAGWLKGTGFRTIRTKNLGDTSLIIGRK
ncbi:MAG: methyltransferase [Nitrospiraceae bacterium]|nr:methyltransferase [Nitrospiraceae bacterium]